MKELQETQLQFVSPVNFLIDQLIILLPVTFVWLTGLAWSLKSRQYRAIGYVYILVIILLLFGRGKSYYTVGMYPCLIAVGAAAIEHFTKSRTWLRGLFIVIIIVPTFFLLPMDLPIWKPEKLKVYFQKESIRKSGFLRWEDQLIHPLPQDYSDMLGWKELTEKAENFYHSLPIAEQNDCMIYCRNYGQAGALKYYSADNAFKEKVFSDNGTFLLWIQDDLDFKHLIFVGRRMPGSDDEVFNHFEKRTVIDSVTNRLSRQFRDKIIFFENADSVAAKLAREGLNEMKSEFRR